MIETYVPLSIISTKRKTPKHICKLLLEKKKLYIDCQSRRFHKAAYKKCSKDYDMAVASSYDEIEDPFVAVTTLPLVVVMPSTN